jgi:hypothetical protein
VAKLCGLLTVLTIPSILRVLMLSRQSSEPVKAFRRYVVTLTHMLEWYDGDLLEPTSRYDALKKCQRFSFLQRSPSRTEFRRI